MPFSWISGALPSSAQTYARLLWRFAAMLALIGVATVAVSAYLLETTLHKAQAEVFGGRFHLAVQRAVSAAENALALNLPLAPATALADGIAREAALEPLIHAFAIQDRQGHPLITAPGQASSRSDGAPWAQLREPIRNDLGETIAWAHLEYDSRALAQSQAQLHRQLLGSMGAAMALSSAGLALLCAALVGRLRSGRQPLRFMGGERGILGLGAGLLLALALALQGWQAHDAAQAAIGPDQMARAQAQARASAALVARALDVGVPLDAIAGWAEHAATLRSRSPELAALALQAPDGQLLDAQSFTPPLPEAPTVRASVTSDGALRAYVILALDTGVLARQLRALLLDMAFLGTACLLLALEWAALGRGTRAARALLAWQRRCARLAHHRMQASPTGSAAVRPALFLFMLSEEIIRPFLPTWARALAPLDSPWSPSLLAGLPLVVFLALVALLQWPLALRSARWGRRPGMVWGAGLGALALAAAALWPQYAVLVGARLLGALGFALVFVSAQGAVIDGSEAHNRSRSLAEFVRAILVAGLCGPPLGGMVADRWGESAAMAMAAAAAAAAAIVAWWQMPRTHNRAQDWASTIPAIANSSLSSANLPSANLPSPANSPNPGPIATLLLGCALPAKLLLAALCFYLLPLHLQDLGYGNAVAGRLQMIYPLTMVLLVPLAAHLADRWGARSAFVVMGGCLAGLSTMATVLGEGRLDVLALILLGLGLGQAMAITAQSALVAEQASALGSDRGAALLGVFRLTERSGSALGPVLAALLLPLWGFGTTVAALGALSLLGHAVYAAHAKFSGDLWPKPAPNQREQL